MWVLRWVVAQAMSLVLQYHVCAVNVKQLVGVEGDQDAANVRLSEEKIKGSLYCDAFLLGYYMHIRTKIT